MADVVAPKSEDPKLIIRVINFELVQPMQRSLILAPIESAYAISYWSSIVTLVLCSGGARILEQVGPAAGPKVVW